MSHTKYMDALTKYGSVRKAAAALGVKRSTFFDNLNKERSAIERVANAQMPMVDPVRGANKPRYYIFTSAVRGAPIHTDFFNNLTAYAKHLGAEFIIGPLTSVGRQRYAEYDSREFAQELVPYISQEPVVIGDRIRFCPELNLSPTMVKPLQGLQTYTKKMWGIFPHTKVSMETVATHKDRPAKFIATTGCVTHPHYTPTKAGLRAHFDHVHGAVIVEVTKKGVWFRHIAPKNEIDGTFYDLGYVVSEGKVDWNDDGVLALVYGDIHVEKLDPQVAKATWGLGAHPKSNFTPLTGHVKPITQIYHDLLDMTAANHHELDNMFKRYGSWIDGHNSLAGALDTAIDFLNDVYTQSENNIVVDSNHDYFVEKWLLKWEPSSKEDFDNIDIFYKLKLALLRAIREKDQRSFLKKIIDVQAEATSYEDIVEMVRFLSTDESYEIANIECGWHGHLGPNGRRGSKHAFKFVTEKSTIAHLHSPSIESGCHVVGTSSKLDLGYNNGPSSWAHTHGIIYPDGNRAMLTMSDGKFWATQGDVW